MGKRVLILVIGAALLAGGLYLLFHSPATGETTLQVIANKIFSLPFVMIITGLFASLYGLLHGLRFSKPVYLVLGVTLFSTGLYFLYGTYGIVSKGVVMHDIFFSPGIALMGAGLYIIVMTLRGRRV